MPSGIVSGTTKGYGACVLIIATLVVGGLATWNAHRIADSPGAHELEAIYQAVPPLPGSSVSPNTGGVFGKDGSVAVDHDYTTTEPASAVHQYFDRTLSGLGWSARTRRSAGAYPWTDEFVYCKGRLEAWVDLQADSAAPVHTFSFWIEQPGDSGFLTSGATSDCV